MKTKFIVPLLMILSCTPNGFDGSPMITFVGDSITAGTINDPAIPGDIPNKEKLCWKDNCFFARIRDSLKDDNISILNRGYGGATSRDWDPNDFLTDDIHYKFFGMATFLTIPPSNIVVIYLGANDAVAFLEGPNIPGVPRVPPTSPEEFIGHIADISLTLTRRGVKRIFLVTPPVPAAWEHDDRGDRMRAYADQIRLLARETPFTLIDVAAVYPSTEWMGDAIHPTIEGSRIIAETILDSIGPSIQALRK